MSAASSGRAVRQGARRVRKAAQGIPQAGEIPRAGVLQGDTAGDPPDVGKSFEVAAHLAGQAAVIVEQGGDGQVAAAGRVRSRSG